MTRPDRRKYKHEKEKTENFIRKTSRTVRKSFQKEAAHAIARQVSLLQRFQTASLMDQQCDSLDLSRWHPPLSNTSVSTVLSPLLERPRQTPFISPMTEIDVPIAFLIVMTLASVLFSCNDP